MLSLQLKSGEYLSIGDNIVVQVFRDGSAGVKVMVDAPRALPILRGEVLERSGQRPGAVKAGKPPSSKSPSDLRHNARRLEQWADRKERRAAQDRQAEERRAAFLADMRRGLGRAGAAAGIPADLRRELAALQARLADYESGRE